MGALAMGDVWYGETTRNPWSMAEGSSGSSAGSGFFGFGGITALRYRHRNAGQHRVALDGLRYHGVAPDLWPREPSRRDGPELEHGQNRADLPLGGGLRLVFNAIYGADGLDPTLIDAPFNYAPVKSLKGMRIGYLKKAFESNYNNKTNDSLTLVELKKLGAELVPMELPDNYPLGGDDLRYLSRRRDGFRRYDPLQPRRPAGTPNKNAWPNSSARPVSYPQWNICKPTDCAPNSFRKCTRY